MPTFEILCVTMKQTDFSKIQEMNIHTNVVFSNQSSETSYSEREFEGHKARMITTATRGVGINRNFGLMYASADICLFADDDVTYRDDLENVVLGEFSKHPDAEVIIFHLDTDSKARKQRKYSETRKHGHFERMPWGACRIAFRLDAQRKANLWFTTLFGGGCIFPSGEDSLWLNDAKRAGLVFYVSNQTIGQVSFEESSWFSGANDKYYYGKGAFYQAVHPQSRFIWMLYFAFRTHRASSVSFINRMKLMRDGAKGYLSLKSFEEYSKG